MVNHSPLRWFDSISNFKIKCYEKADKRQRMNIRLSARHRPCQFHNSWSGEVSKSITYHKNMNLEESCVNPVSHLLSVNFGLDEDKNEEGITVPHNSCAATILGALVQEE
uniref:SJCHGC03393 protein n=1 Tax=Schistosoma japonicum TaxID=6182 RepID=Q5D9H0_SCHJA|nr:SJCHGC03393 protein [Schistosoma japonicum]